MVMGVGDGVGVGAVNKWHDLFLHYDLCIHLHPFLWSLNIFAS
jgi:hypothetical protein